MDYFVNKKERASRAKTHFELMQHLFGGSKEETYSFQHATIYGANAIYPVKSVFGDIPDILVTKNDSVSAIFDYTDENEKVAVLNFASYKNPGGMFLNGSSAQEESLCHSSNLYNILIKFNNSFYAYNRQNLNSSLYLDRALYTPRIIFSKSEDFLSNIRICDVITCAAPNYRTASKKGVSLKSNRTALKQRIHFINAIAEANHVDALILGAWGTGVFGQDVDEVATLFRDIFKSTSIKKIIHPIPDDKTFKIFQTVFSLE